MKKYKAEVTYTVRYEIDPSNYPKIYPKGSTSQKCLEIDLADFRNDPESLCLMEDPKGPKEALKGRIIDVVA